MKNFDRALAYAKQRGVELPNIHAMLEKKTNNELKVILSRLGVVTKNKAKKSDLVQLAMIEMIKPHLTQAQIKRLGQKHDDKRTLRDRHATRIERKIRRRRWQFT